jgi:hypothetical protein
LRLQLGKALPAVISQPPPQQQQQCQHPLQLSHQMSKPSAPRPASQQLTQSPASRPQPVPKLCLMLQAAGSQMMRNPVPPTLLQIRFSSCSYSLSS